MPKVKPLTENERRDAAIKKQIYGEMKVARMDSEDVANAIGIAKNTLYRRMKSPETLTLREIRAIRKLFPEVVIE